MRYLLPFITGFIVGVLFRLLKLPIPAPAVIEGILGIFGIWCGYAIITLF